MKSKIKNRIIPIVLLVPIIMLLGEFLFTEENILILKTVFTKDLSNDQIQDKLAEIGWRGYITVAILSMLQVLIAVLPAEPLQVVAGLTFGFPIGVATCMAGVIIANATIFFSYKIFGEKIRKYFDKKIDIDLENAGSNGSAYTTAID